jgi:hypothetical protein
MITRMAIFSFVVTALAASWGFASNPWLGKTLDPKHVKQRWGDSSFSEQTFKEGRPEERAKMAYSLMSTKQFMGLTPSQVREKLGAFDGHYFSESYPTYLIQRAEKKGEESWQIVFLIGNDRKTKEVIVHKNCCD